MVEETIKYIYTEDPKEHWKFLNCTNERVVDFGCCYNDKDQENTRVNKLGTPQFILAQNPIMYVGLDIYEPDLIELKKEIQQENAFFFNLKLDSSEKVQKVFDDYLPTVIKMDIEGAELYMCDTVPPNCLKQIAVESHNQQIENMLISWSNKWNFALTSVEALAQHPHIKILYFNR